MIFEPVTYTNPKEFVDETVARYRESVGNSGVVGFISGGADSTTCAKLSLKAIGGSKSYLIHFDHGGMRKGECDSVLRFLHRDCNIPTIFHDYTENFLGAVISAGSDSEEKRKKFSKAYFDAALEETKNFGAKFFLQGTIEPDWLETSKHKLKRQHNVLLEEQKNRFRKQGIQVIEPLYHLRKHQVREVARYLGIPDSVAKRKPFPGPGFYCRIVGQVNRDKMEALREADSIVMPDLEKYTEEIAEQDFQCLCALMDNKVSEVDIGPNFTYGINIEGRPKITESRVTGMVENKRSYTNMLLIDSPNHTTAALAYASEDIIRKNLDRGIGRCAVLINEREKKGEYIAVLRSVLTKDFTKAEATQISRDNLDKIADALLELGPPSISEVYYDVTDKPPATIEFE